MNKMLKQVFGGLVGPAAVIAAGTMGAGSVAVLILAGAWFRYNLLWVVLFMLPLFVVAVDSSSRIGTVNQGKGMLSIVSRRMHPSVAWILLLINVPIHILVAMGQFSVMTSAFLSLMGMNPPGVNTPQTQIDHYMVVEVFTSIALAGFVVWLVLSHGYERMQKAMTALMILMFICFFVIALRSFSDAGDILAGFIPNIPRDLPAPGRDAVRLTSSSIIAIVGSAIAPGALLVIPYLSSDARKGSIDLKQDLRKFIVNLGVVFGAYAMFILIAGGYALYPLPNHADIETVHEAGQVLTKALPPSIDFVGPTIFTLGLFVAAMTTLVICVQVVIYLSLDMFNKPWEFTEDNRLYRRLVILITLLSGALAPVWSFPAMLKVILLMGVNVFIIPLVIITMIFLLNRREVMGTYTAGTGRNVLLALCLIVAIALAVNQFPGYLAMFSDVSG